MFRFSIYKRHLILIELINSTTSSIDNDIVKDCMEIACSRCVVAVISQQPILI